MLPDIAEYHDRLLALVRKNLNPILLKRMSYEDVVQSVYEAAAKRPDYFTNNPEVPVYFKLRTILFQTLTDIERRELKAQGRDVYKEIEPDPDLEIAADVTSPVSRVDRNERHALLRRTVAALDKNDRQIIILRHFDGLGNTECAKVLGIEPKAASIRYVRALGRLKEKLLELSCFGK